MLLFAYLVTRNPAWEGSRLRVLSAASRAGEDQDLENLKQTLQEVRIDAEPLIVEGTHEDRIVERSADADLVFLPFRLRDRELTCPLGVDLGGLLPRLPVTALVLAARDIELDAEPEEGKAGELAQALDALADAGKAADAMEKEAADAAEEAEKSLQDLESAMLSGGGEDLNRKLKAVSEAKGQALKAARRAAKATAKAEDAAREAERLGADTAKKGPSGDEKSGGPDGNGSSTLP